MNRNNEFDELARQKLGEQSFPFEEAHWLDAQRTIAAQRTTRKGGGLWYIAGGAMLLLGAWLLWPSSETTIVADAEQITGAEPVQGPPSSVVPTELPPTAPVTNSEEVIPTEPNVPARAEAGEAIEPKQTHSSTQGVATQAERNDALPATSPAIAPNEPVMVAPPPSPTAEEHGVEPATPAVAGEYNEPVAAEPATMTEQGSTPEVGTTEGVAGDLAVSEGAVVVLGTAAVIDPGIPQNTGDIGAAEPVAETPQSNSTDGTVNEAGVEPTQATSSTTSDSLLAVAPNDSAGTAPQPVPASPPIIDPRAPWEIGVLGGLFQTTSVYSGATSDTWEVDPLSATAFGAELMHMGRNIGFGVGLQYGTYADRLRTPEENRTSVSYDESWYLQPVDTTVLIITGYDPITQLYQGHSVHITINQLRMTTDTVTTTTLARAAREQINRTSYLEVPVLFDAHLVQGRWSLGLRGGPTVGLLTQRQGSVPSGDGEGYTEFNDVAMRSWVMGWTARAYVRYRFNSAWSVGVEPAARGQLMDNFDEQGVTRRSSAIGGMISLSYRLP